MNFYTKNKDRIKIFWAKDKKNWDLKKLNKLWEPTILKKLKIIS